MIYCSVIKQIWPGATFVVHVAYVECTQLVARTAHKAHAGPFEHGGRIITGGWRGRRVVYCDVIKHVRPATFVVSERGSGIARTWRTTRGRAPTEKVDQADQRVFSIKSACNDLSEHCRHESQEGSQHIATHTEIEADLPEWSMRWGWGCLQRIGGRDVWSKASLFTIHTLV